MLNPFEEGLTGYVAEATQGHVIPVYPDLLEKNPSTETPNVTCSLVSISVKGGQKGQVFSGSAMTMGGATERAIQDCMSAGLHMSMCLPNLGATVNCQ